MPDVVRVCYLTGERLTELAGRQDLLAVLSAGERAQAERFWFARDRDSYVGAHVLLRLMLSAAHSAVAPGAWQFTATEHGKPQLAEAFDCGLDFSISHTDGMAVCGVAQGRAIGIDAEHSGRRAPLDIAGECLTAAELADLAARAQEHKAERFFFYWTLKEAYLKALGVGLHRPLSSVAIGQDADGALRVTAPESPAEWRLEWHAIGVHRLAVCCAGGIPEPCISISEWQIVGAASTGNSNS